jgi:hypothetical protein
VWIIALAILLPILSLLGLFHEKREATTWLVQPVFSEPVSAKDASGPRRVV